MRSVIFHLVGVTRQMVAECLAEISTPNGPAGWRMPRGAATSDLYIDFYDNLLEEVEPGELDQLRASLGRLPDVSVAVHVSGRVSGDAEVRELAAYVLGKFSGVVQDEYTLHCWTLAEIQSDAVVEGHPFFDYRGSR